MDLLRFVLARLLRAIPVLLGVVVCVFLTIHLVPGDPVRIMMHGRISDEDVAAIYQQLGMDRPLIVQFFDFLRNAIVGDLGTSLIQKASVTTLVLEKLWPTLLLLSLSAVFSTLIAIPLSLLAAYHRDRWPDHAVRLGSIVGFAMPPYWIGLLLVLFFGIALNWFPIAGMGEGPVDNLYHMAMPALTISLFLGPVLIQSLRASMLDALTSEYVEVAMAKGLSDWQILTRHVLRNALIPVITVLAVNMSWLLSSAVVVEYVFGLPGLGSLLVRAVGYRDYPLIQGVSLIFAVIVIVINLLADLSYTLVDRRILKGKP
ncbi:ABC transporter permease [Pikeienuella piscinae]|uniref:ABC transporter permease n=1 Tax=Pikeienuella piscinae TaxID=2748098 RepID=A0A7L5C1Q7_9RHOB|nr:ABC transporter permease [Pikeienuella piscinae]QIE56747.1 ABC transporter permease [Pikeienuella piscinae]